MLVSTLSLSDVTGFVGFEPVGEGHAPSALFPLRGAEPRFEAIAYGLHHRPDRARVHLHEVDVLRVATCWIEMKLVERGSPSKRQLTGKEVIGEEIDKGAAKRKVLLG